MGSSEKKVQVGLVIKSEDAKAIQDLVKFGKQQEKLAAQMQKVLAVNEKFNKSQKKQGDALRDGRKKVDQQGRAYSQMSRQISKAAGLIGGYVTASKGLQLVKSMITSVTDAYNKNAEAAANAMSALTRYSMLSSMDKKSRELILGFGGTLDIGERTEVGFRAISKKGSTNEYVKQILQEATFAKKGGEDPMTFGKAVVGLGEGVMGSKSASQISSFLSTMAAESPVSADQYSTLFAEVGGFGETDREQAAGGALVSALVKSMGADADPKRASTIAKAFMVKRKLIAKDFMKMIDASGKSIPEQIDIMADTMHGAEWTQADAKGVTLEEHFYKAFGQKTAPGLSTLLRSEKSRAGIESDIEAGVTALHSTGPSVLARKVAKKGELDPEWAMMQRTEETKTGRAMAEIGRGYSQSPYTLTKEQLAHKYEAWGGGTKGGRFIEAAQNLEHPLETATPVGQVKLMFGYMMQLKEYFDVFNKNTKDLADALAANTVAQEKGGAGAAVVDMGGSRE